MVRLAVYGDHNATLSTYSFRGQAQSTNGLPVNDITLLRMTEYHVQNFQTIFWCNSYPLMGAQAILEDESYLMKPPDTRWIPYHKMPRKRGFYSKTFWQVLTQRQTGLIVQNYFDMNEFIHREFGTKMIILPIAAYIFDRILDLNLGIYSQLREYDWRMVDLSGLDSLTNEQAFTEKNCLTEQAYRLIEPKIFEFVQN